jgi:hypothetical protein
MVACPNISETILGLTFLDSSSVAQVCRRSWNRIGGNPAGSSKGLKRRAVTYWRRRSSPISEANIRPFSCHREPTLSISLSAGSWPHLEP